MATNNGMHEFVESIRNHYSGLRVVDYEPGESEIVCVEWDDSKKGREQITKLQLEVTRHLHHENIEVKYANLAREYVLFVASTGDVPVGKIEALVEDCIRWDNDGYETNYANMAEEIEDRLL